MLRSRIVAETAMTELRTPHEDDDAARLAAGLAPRLRYTLFHWQEATLPAS